MPPFDPLDLTQEAPSDEESSAAPSLLSDPTEPPSEEEEFALLGGAGAALDPDQLTALETEPETVVAVEDESASEADGAIDGESEIAPTEEQLATTEPILPEELTEFEKWEAAQGIHIDAVDPADEVEEVPGAPTAVLDTDVPAEEAIDVSRSETDSDTEAQADETESAQSAQATEEEESYSSATETFTWLYRVGAMLGVLAAALPTWRRYYPLAVLRRSKESDTARTLAADGRSAAATAAHLEASEETETGIETTPEDAGEKPEDDHLA